MFFVLDFLLPLALTSAVSADGAGSQDCLIRFNESENLVTLQGAVDARRWVAGSYILKVETRQNGGVSVSQQTGAFDGAGLQNKEFLVLSSTTIYLSSGAHLRARLNVNDGKQRSSCSLSYRK